MIKRILADISIDSDVYDRLIELKFKLHKQGVISKSSFAALITYLVRQYLDKK